MSLGNVRDAGTSGNRLGHDHRSKGNVVDAAPLTHDLDPWHCLAICGCHSGSHMLASHHAAQEIDTQLPGQGGRRRRDTLSAPVVLMPPWTPADDGAGGHHCIAELFVPGLPERLREHPLLPTVWTERQPVRLVTARTILFAAMANFLADPKAAYARIAASLGWTGRSAVERWLLRLPDHEARILAPRGKGGAGCVSQLQQM